MLKENYLYSATRKLYLLQTYSKYNRLSSNTLNGESNLENEVFNRQLN